MLRRKLIVPGVYTWRSYVSVLVAERDQLKGALASMKQELDEVRCILRELKAAVLARQNAEAELADQAYARLLPAGRRFTVNAHKGPIFGAGYSATGKLVYTSAKTVR